jgi:hypothetical protein
MKPFTVEQLLAKLNELGLDVTTPIHLLDAKFPHHDFTMSSAMENATINRNGELLLISRGNGQDTVSKQIFNGA